MLLSDLGFLDLLKLVLNLTLTNIIERFCWSVSHNPIVLLSGKGLPHTHVSI